MVAYEAPQCASELVVKAVGEAYSLYQAFRNRKDCRERFAGCGPIYAHTRMIASPIQPIWIFSCAAALLVTCPSLRDLWDPLDTLHVVFLLNCCAQAAQNQMLVYVRSEIHLQMLAAPAGAWGMLSLIHI